jgi:hypothetical protein
MIGLGIVIWLKRRRDGYQSANARRNAGILRVATYATVLSVGFGVWGIRSAKAELADKALDIGKDLAAIADVMGEATELNLNGQRVHIGTGISSSSLADVLGQYEKRCGEGGSTFADLAHAVGTPDGVPDAKHPNTLSTAGVSRREKPGEGVVFCAVSAKHAERQAVDVFEEFAASHNLGVFGQVRYAYVKALANGRTQMMTMWTDESFDLDALVPDPGKEAPGKDSELMPRPTNARRLLSAEVTGTPYAVRIYESRTSSADITKFYSDFAAAHEFIAVVDKPGDHADDASNVERIAFEKDGVMLVVVAQQSAGGGSVVTVAEVGAAGHGVGSRQGAR